MKFVARLVLVVSLAATSCLAGSSATKSGNAGEELARVEGLSGRSGGQLVVALRAEPKTLNPLTATDALSREVIGQMTGDLIHINRASQQTEPALAKSWKISPDGRSYTLKLRRGLRFSDGHRFDADDVIFSFSVYLDKAVGSTQRDLLIIDDKPIAVTKLDQYTVRFQLPHPYAAAERLFDSVAMLPKHLLERPYREGKLAEAWPLNTPAMEIAGLGPFRLREYLPGQRIVLERNPYYWKTDSGDHRLPYLDELAFVFAGTEDAQLMRFEAGETDVISRLSSENFALLTRDQARYRWQLRDLGPSLEYNFVVFNLNDLGGKNLDAIAREQKWFREQKFRQAVSLAIDRQAIVRLVYGTRGTALWGNVAPGNRFWIDSSIPHPARSLDQARQLLREAGFSWNNSGQLLDKSGTRVEFSIITSSSNTQRMKMATLLQDDLAHLGMEVHVVPLEFRAMLDRVFQSFNYDAAIMGLGGGDADPNSEMNVWLSSGGTHLWHLDESQPATPWEAEIDRLMQQQMVTLNYEKRKQLYDRVQQLISENLPFIFLATPNVLVGAETGIGNFKPAILESSTLWNADQLYLDLPGKGPERAGIR